MSATWIAERAVDFGAAQKMEELAGVIGDVLELAPAVVVEIGSMNGGTLQAWRAAVPDATLISISLTDGPYGGGTVPELLADHHLDGDSHDATTLAWLLGVLDGRPIDFLFIDGDHSYLGVLQDWAMYAWLVRPGGLVAFHDILSHADGTEVYVKQLWDQLAAAYPHHEHVVPEHLRDYGVWGGIGVIHR